MATYKIFKMTTKVRIVISDKHNRINETIIQKYKLEKCGFPFASYDSDMSYTETEQYAKKIIEDINILPLPDYSFPKLRKFVKLWISRQQQQNTWLEIYSETFELLKLIDGVSAFTKIISGCITDLVNNCQRIEDFESVKRCIHILIDFGIYYEDIIAYDDKHESRKKYPKIQHIGEDIMLNKKAEWITFNNQRRQLGLEPLATFPTQKDIDDMAKYDQRSGSEGSSM